MTYVGRFAPTPSGPLHAGSLVAALGGWLDARANEGQWLVRFEDVDSARTQSGAVEAILQQLNALGLHHDGTVIQQSQRSDYYQHALDRLRAQGAAYACTCTRQSINATLRALGTITPRGAELVYPGTCRSLPPSQGVAGRAPSWRWRCHDDPRANRIVWHDRWQGSQSQDVRLAVGDFVLKRSDGPFAYQLAVVVDDALQGVTHIVRGQDLSDNTPRQVALQRCLNLPSVSYMHVPLALDARGDKLSKSNGAPSLVVVSAAMAVSALAAAARTLKLVGVNPHASNPAAWLNEATVAWRTQYPLGPVNSSSTPLHHDHDQ